MSQRPLKLVITAGGTREYIDPVRFISNASSGRMGYALARAAVKAGHHVTLISAPTALRPPTGATVVPVETSEQMFTAVKTAVVTCDGLIMAAAVSDYKPAETSGKKLKKHNAALTLRLEPTRDILAWAGKHKRPGQKIVGFALEDNDVLENAADKFRRKKLDMIVANTPDAIGATRSTLHIKTRDKDWHVLNTTTKHRSAETIIALLEQLFDAC